MTRITNVDQALLLLRSRLQRIERSRVASRHCNSTSQQLAALDRLRELATNGHASYQDVQRALVVSVLIDALGDSIAKDARFEGLVSRVIDRLLEVDERRLVEEAVRNLLY